MQVSSNSSKTVPYSGPSRLWRGFTLIELLVVLAIVATLLTFVTPRYFSHIQSSKETVLRDNLRTTRDVIDKFYGDLGRYPDSLQELVDKNYLRSLPLDPLTESDTTWMLVGVPSGYKGSVYGLKSGAPGNSREGKPYAEW
jgi:general secretion pathway protein G